MNSFLVWILPKSLASFKPRWIARARARYVHVTVPVRIPARNAPLAATMLRQMKSYASATARLYKYALFRMTPLRLCPSFLLNRALHRN